MLLLLSLQIPEFSKTKTLFSQVVNCRCSFPTKKTSKKHLWMLGWTYFSCSYRWPYCWLWIFSIPIFMEQFGQSLKGNQRLSLISLTNETLPTMFARINLTAFRFLAWIHLDTFVSHFYLETLFWDVFTLDSYLCTLHTKCIQTRYILHSNTQMYL